MDQTGKTSKLYDGSGCNQKLEKIEMVRLTDNKYWLDHAVTATQKTIRKAFGMDADMIKYYAGSTVYA